MRDLDLSILRDFVRSDGGYVLLNLLAKIQVRQEEILKTDSLTKPLDEIRRTAGRIEGVSFVIEEIKKLRKADAKT